ncbi:prenyltransferase/squalene oxidase repeat-containing protein [Saccharothrix syringae]|uniref:Prenyltransferase n=1 Tax=Saccharothrix syringae TaxID=103733 RepID=A0A5Q0GX66_SACSY|nr:prenyltransferase/squalene oxidase repeat-containing protein [Saccharothrix syringae]QFZ18637.1 prenyltransferase [Saccharothrix syringae]
MRSDVNRCRDRLARRVLDRVGPTGLVDAPCTSRVLESALLVALLDREGLAPDRADAARGFLRAALDSDPPDPLQCALGRAALGEAVTGEPVLRDLLSRVGPDHAARKLLVFRTLLAELGAAEHPRDVPGAVFEAGHQASWVRLQLSALKVITAPGTAGEADWACLRPALRPGPVWEASHFTRLVGLFALRRNPVYRPAVRDALLRVAAEQRSGGGLPFITGLDVFATAIAGIALARVTPEEPRVVSMADGLVAQQNPDGGFGYTVGVRQSDVDDTAYGIEFLRALAPRRHRDVILAAEEYVLAQQNPDGGFPTFGRGAPSEVAITAGAVNALAPDPAHRGAVERGVGFVVDARQVVERGWSRNASNVLFRVALACGALAPDAAVALRSAAHGTRRRAWRYLVDTQGPDGGWGHERGDASDPISTAYAVVALAASPDHAAALGRAVDYLVTRQQPDGGYRSRPDQAGPRPLLYDTPALADIAVLLALSACGER